MTSKPIACGEPISYCV